MGARLLVVDDNPELLDSMKDILEDAGYSLITAVSVQSAIELIPAEPFDLALIDLQLPDGSGIQIAEAIKSKKPAIRIILITGQAEETASPGLTARQRGIVDHYLVKPVNPVQLLNTVARILS
jgi:CheY-like chemotaxis protein